MIFTIMQLEAEVLVKYRAKICHPNVEYAEGKAALALGRLLISFIALCAELEIRPRHV